jgi:hypothetical protein
MVLLGCTPDGRVTEQHDVFFGIAENLTELIPQMNLFWPEAKGKLHIDAWREVTIVDNHSVEVVSNATTTSSQDNLYFLNLGGYKPNEFEEYHYKMLTVSPTLSDAIKESKKTAFYKHCGFKGAVSHIDDKYGIDVDDLHKVADLLNAETKSKFQLKISSLIESKKDDELHIGYVKIKKL